VTLVVGVLAAGAAIGGTYLGSRSAADVSREELAGENQRHRYDVRKDAYARLATTTDRYIVRATEVPTHRTGARRHLLTSDRFAARAAFTEAKLVGDPAVVQTGLDAIKQLEQVDVDDEVTDDDEVRALIRAARAKWDAFMATATRDLDALAKTTD
jgi:hypothetical protein